MGLFTSLAIAAGLGTAAGIGISKSVGKGGGGGPAAPIPLPQPPTPEAAADKAQEIVRRKKVAMSQSIYTSPLGVAGEANIARKTLLGQ